MTTSMSPSVVTGKLAARALVRDAQRMGKSTGVVMTMGALHEGHLSLVKECVSGCDHTVVTIFVNPTQFKPGEDFENYPRDMDCDLAVLRDLPVDFVFAPQPEEIYGGDFSTYIDPPQVAQSLEGEFRPGHFRGVCTIVFKLLQIVPADVAFFGRKDYQQYIVVRQMAKDLDLPVEIRSCPTVREVDGLAMSSRNRYLSPAERQQATAIHRSLQLGQQLFQEGQHSRGQISKQMRELLLEAGIQRIDYATIADAETLLEVSEANRAAVALVAAYVGGTRLIDNLPLT